jgi:hypothetical protein
MREGGMARLSEAASGYRSSAGWRRSRRSSLPCWWRSAIVSPSASATSPRCWPVGDAVPADHRPAVGPRGGAVATLLGSLPII